ncbi:PII uridylyl-transferase [Legionella massiliensis]|uniref:Bifunctional uridylyltransferase/uridylyl-removing enzyme n=1 Tax=Legionella massiliensis TaxID=1034943 RepID=A0A078L1G0_9GAMM|nr:[protein-PII] uridylyltransferase [Legionella massiliensis]CDZ79077.1 PII uridylyl-transferase [Legionella massiliensis]CEE14815.1 Bifunctional uridylyltransferase/uridylyl-removing enzyme [Legionella massiliensis]
MKNDNFTLKSSIKQFKDELCEEFCQKGNITSLTHKLVLFIDEILYKLFHKNKLDENNCFCLLALGSYGRRELQLYSDVDLLLLRTEKISKTDSQRAQAFIQDCWDIGLEVSHQITTVSACAELAAKDLTVISSILDMHLLCGRGNLMEELAYQTHPLHMWPSHEYFFAKQQEQNQRYAKYGETAYNLEPNVKNGPGGLRDLQILLSISKRHFGVKKLADGINCGFITDKEYEELIACQHYLWKVRFALHILAEKQEERLLFDYQIKLATLFGFSDNEQSLAIEQFMKAYFKVIKRSRELNEMLLQWFAEAIVHHQKQRITPLDNFFQLSNDYIEVRNPRVFSHKPQALLELFLWIARRPDIRGVRASTIRLIRQHLYLIGNRFRQAKFAHQAFLALFKTEDPYEALHHMNRYGVLSHYLDCFAAVTGQMQYDLFHVYTVDQHTLFVIRNLARFLKADYAKQFPLAAKLMPQIENRAILYLSALFHDIAKGRGGDHSELGAEEARQFANRHKLEAKETDLLVWLVLNHLLMSQTAQRQDIYDPKTVQHFCSLLPQADYLEYLYLLTVADICATNHNLWNAWKDSLLKELYRAAKQFMQQEQALLDETTLINTRKKEALAILIKENLLAETILNLWATFKDKYFLHQPSTVIARHSKAIIECKQYPLVQIMPHHSQGGTEVFIYMPHRDERFTISTTVLSNHDTTIQEAAILTCDNNFDLDTYIILDEQHQAFFDEQRTVEIQQALVKQLSDMTHIPTISRRRLSRTQAHFRLEPQINFSEEMDKLQLSSFFLITPDRPGLLAAISRVFLSLGIHLHHAKIATAGERAEDMFFISSKEGQALNKEEKDRLKQALIKELTELSA